MGDILLNGEPIAPNRVLVLAVSSQFAHNRERPDHFYLQGRAPRADIVDEDSAVSMMEICLRKLEHDAVTADNAPAAGRMRLSAATREAAGRAASAGQGGAASPGAKRALGDPRAGLPHESSDQGMRCAANILFVSSSFAHQSRRVRIRIFARTKKKGLTRVFLSAVSRSVRGAADTSRELFRHVNALLRIAHVQDSWGAPIAIGTDNHSKLLRMAEVFAQHQVRICTPSSWIRRGHRKKIKPGQACLADMTELQRACLRKLQRHDVGTLVSVAGLAMGSRKFADIRDQFFFADDTPAGVSY